MILKNHENMNCFRLLSSVLDEIWDDLEGDEGTREVTVQNESQRLRERYAKLMTSSTSVNYRNPATRYAYLAVYVASHANMVTELIRLCEEQFVGLFRGNTQITCVGGGPGSDLLGIIKYVQRLKPIETEQRLKFHLLDHEQAWSDSWSDVDDKLSISLSTYFDQLDVTNKSSWQLITKYLKADLFTMVYFISEIYQRRDEAKPFFENLFKRAKQGACFLIIDNSTPEFLNWIDELADNNDITLRKKSDNMTLQLPPSEEKKDLGIHLKRIGQLPKLSGQIACRILQKPLEPDCYSG